MGHYIENIGDTPQRLLEMFKSSYSADLSLNQWLALLPSELVQAHMKFDPKLMQVLRKEKRPVVPAWSVSIYARIRFLRSRGRVRAIV
jgi:oxalate decarboxylase